jgi:hypothetical protein
MFMLVRRISTKFGHFFPDSLIAFDFEPKGLSKPQFIY